MDVTDQKRLRDNLQAEIDGASLYRALAQIEAESELATVYTHMAEAEERHATIWRTKLRESGVTDLPTKPGWRTQPFISAKRAALAAVPSGEGTGSEATVSVMAER